MKKTLITIVATVFLCCCLIGTTYAWLVAKTDPITNTFTVGNINITLSEKSKIDDLKIVPGRIYKEEPTVTVAGGSESCWLFIKIEETNNTFNSNPDQRFITYVIADGWTLLESGVYYREVANSNAAQEYSILSNGEVKIDSSVTKTMIDSIALNNTPTIEFTAYAVQKEGISTVTDAWGVATTGALPTT